MTCDTMFFDGLFNKDNLGSSDLLIAHISQPDSEELSDPTHLKKGHLGYRGTAKLIQNSEMKLNLITEFCGGKGDLCIELTHGLRQLCKNNTIFPGSIGCIIDLNKIIIQCTNCKNFTSPNKLMISPSLTSFGRL